MANSKRARLSLEWYTISKRTLYLLVASLLGVAGLIGGGLGLYRYLNRQLKTEAQVWRQKARFTQIEGRVLVKRANSTEFITAREEMELEAGDTVQTQGKSLARVQFVDGSSYTIKPDTTLVIKDNILLSDKTTRVHVAVGIGTINLATGEQSAGSSNVVQTEQASARVGSHTEASVAAGERTEIRITRGSANVQTRAGESFAARSNELFEVTSDGRLARHERMLPAPTLLAPENQRYLQLGQSRTGTVTFQWTAIPQAHSYQIEIATSAYFGDTVRASRHHQTSPTAVFDNLAPGSYYWRVRASDEKGVAGPYSEPFVFTLVGGTSRRELSISVVRQMYLGGNSFMIEGRTEPGARVKVGGHIARSEANGDFRAFVTLSGRSRQVLIEAEDQDGNKGQKWLRF